MTDAAAAGRALEPDEALREEFVRIFRHERIGEGDEFWKSVGNIKDGPAALCLSGGGIRSATFSLGVLQGLKDALGQFDYLSTVSGGGYIGSWLSRWLAGEPTGSSPSHSAAFALTEQPDGRRAAFHPLRRLRSFSNFLAPSWGLSIDSLTVATIFVRNLLLNWLFWIPLLLFAATLPWFVTILVRWFVEDRLEVPGISSSSLAIAAFGVPGVTLALWLLLSLAAVFAVTEQLREHLSRAAAKLMLVAIPWLTLFAVFVYLPAFVFGWIEDRGVYGQTAQQLAVYGATPKILVEQKFTAEEIAGGTFTARELKAHGFTPKQIRSYGFSENDLQLSSLNPDNLTLTGFGGAIFAVAAGLVGFWSRHGPDLRKKAYGITNALGTRILDLVAAAALLVLALGASLTVMAGLQTLVMRKTNAALTTYWLQPLAEMKWPDALSFVQTLPAGKDATEPHILLSADTFRHLDAHVDLWAVSATLLGLAGVVLLAGWVVGVNHFSLHALYGNRLVRAYLGSARAGRNPSARGDFDSEDNVAMSALPGGADGPDVGPSRPFHIVNMTLNLTRPSRERLDWQERKGASFTATPLHCGSNVTGYVPSGAFGGRWGMTLGRAMTVSGAAASPNMGYHSSPLMALLMTFFNIRLGWWMPNPAWVGTLDAPLDRSEPRFGLRYVLREAFSGTTAESDWLYLSDGGHFDNLGLYEAVRRRCRLIVVVDAGCDGEYEHSDLHNAVRKIAVDLAVPIDLPSELPGQKGAAERQRVTVGKILYSALGDNYPDGKLYVLKPVLIGGEPPALRDYAEVSRRGGKTFPHHSTADQFFNETQFESYRRLGEWSAADLLDVMSGGMKAHGFTHGLLRTPDETEEAEQATAPPPAALSGLDGVREGVRTLSPIEMVAGIIATAGAVGAAVGTGDRIVDAIVGDPPVSAPTRRGGAPEVEDPAAGPADNGAGGNVLDNEVEQIDGNVGDDSSTDTNASNNSATTLDDIKNEIGVVKTAVNTASTDDSKRSEGLGNQMTALQREFSAHALAADNTRGTDRIMNKLQTMQTGSTPNSASLAAILYQLRSIAVQLQASDPRRNIRGQ